MKSYKNASENPEIIKIRPPYSKKETLYLRELINGGLRKLVDIGKGVNYEEFCDSIISSIPSNTYAPEFNDYWLYWKCRFLEQEEDENRKKIFEYCITDLKAKGLLPTHTSGLTGNFSILIDEIIQKSPTI